MYTCMIILHKNPQLSQPIYHIINSLPYHLRLWCIHHQYYRSLWFPFLWIFDTLYTIHYTLYTIHYTLYTIHYTLYTIHYTLYTIHYTLYTIHYTLYTIHYTLYTIHYTLYTIHYWAFWTLLALLDRIPLYSYVLLFVL